MGCNEDSGHRVCFNNRVCSITEFKIILFSPWIFRYLALKVCIKLQNTKFYTFCTLSALSILCTLSTDLPMIAHCTAPNYLHSLACSMMYQLIKDQLHWMTPLYTAPNYSIYGMAHFLLWFGPLYNNSNGEFHGSEIKVSIFSEN